LHCNNPLKVAVVAAVLAGGLGAKAHAFLDTGTLLTNSASATYSAGAQGSSVTYSATAKILVANPAVFLWKDGTPTQVTASAGGTVDFSICFSNGGANTAFNLTITDKLPNNTYWWGNYSMWYSDLTSTVQTGVIAYYATAGANGPWFPNPPMGQPQPLWIQWVIPNQGVGKSGCVRFTISVG
jgi:uncharacterized repeat protein (TIGR01451 family)